MSLAEIGLPSSLPLPLPKVDWRRVAIVLSSAAAPGVDGAGRTMPCFNMPSLRRVSKERPGVLSNRAASFASRTDLSVPSAPTRAATARSEEHTSELQSLMSSSYAGFCLQKNKKTDKDTNN